MLSTNFKNCLSVSRSAGSRLSNLRRTPKVGLLRVTIPLRIKPFTQIFPFATQSPISSLTPVLTGVAVSTKPPPKLVFERLPQTGVGDPSMRNSTATKHFIRGLRRRSWPQQGVKISGSNGGAAAGVIATGGSGEGLGEADSVDCTLGPLLLILRMVSSNTWSR